MKIIFEINDPVYHFYYGWGFVSSTDYGNSERQFPVIVTFSNSIVDISFTADGREIINQSPTLSFYKYDLVKGGFCQNKPPENIESGTLIYVKNSSGKEWFVRRFSHFERDGSCMCFQNQSSAGAATKWDNYRKTAPF